MSAYQSLPDHFMHTAMPWTWSGWFQQKLGCNQIGLSSERFVSMKCRYGPLESVRLRSVAIRLDKRLPRRAAVILGSVRSAEEHGCAHAYVVFQEPSAIDAALEQNMQLVRRQA